MAEGLAKACSDHMRQYLDGVDMDNDPVGHQGVEQSLN
jgi:hypothetical protein